MTRRRRAKPLPIFWTNRALADLETIGDWIARDDPAAANRWVTRLVAIVEKAALTPFAGRRVPELAREDVRERVLRSYRIVYRVTTESVDVLTVFDGRRLFPDDV